MSSWLSPKTEKRPSGIEGRGLFARERIAAGEIVAVKGGAIMDGSRLAEIAAQVSPAEIQVEDDLFITPTRAAEVEDNMLSLNHCCAPNVGVRGQISFVAMRDVAADEELTIDYAMIDGDPGETMRCTCGAEACRGLITGDDWRRRDLQQAYAGFFSRYLEERMARGTIRGNGAPSETLSSETAAIEADPALLLIDIQQGLDDPYYGERNNPGFEKQVAALLEAWRAAGWPVIHVRHMSREASSRLRPELPGNAFKPEAMPRQGEAVFEKSVNSGFIGTGLEDHLRRAGIHELVIAGLTTDHCVSTTARMADNLGFAVVVVEDATATHERTGPNGARLSADEMHRLALASLHGEFARVESTSRLLEELGLATTAEPEPADGA